MQCLVFPMHFISLCNIQYEAICNLQCSTYKSKMKCAICSMPWALCTVLCILCITYSTIKYTRCKRQPALCMSIYPKCNILIQYAISNIKNYLICKIHGVISNMQYLSCNIQYSISKM